MGTIYSDANDKDTKDLENNAKNMAAEKISFVKASSASQDNNTPGYENYSAPQLDSQAQSGDLLSAKVPSFFLEDEMSHKTAQRHVPTSRPNKEEGGWSDKKPKSQPHLYSSLPQDEQAHEMESRDQKREKARTGFLSEKESRGLWEFNQRLQILNYPPLGSLSNSALIIELLNDVITLHDMLMLEKKKTPLGRKFSTKTVQTPEEARAPYAECRCGRTGTHKKAGAGEQGEDALCKKEWEEFYLRGELETVRNLAEEKAQLEGLFNKEKAKTKEKTKDIKRLKAQLEKTEDALKLTTKNLELLEKKQYQGHSSVLGLYSSGVEAARHGHSRTERNRQTPLDIDHVYGSNIQAPELRENGLARGKKDSSQEIDSLLRERSEAYVQNRKLLLTEKDENLIRIENCDDRVYLKRFLRNVFQTLCVYKLRSLDKDWSEMSLQASLKVSQEENQRLRACIVRKTKRLGKFLEWKDKALCILKGVEESSRRTREVGKSVKKHMANIREEARAILAGVREGNKKSVQLEKHLKRELMWILKRAKTLTVEPEKAKKNYKEQILLSKNEIPSSGNDSDNLLFKNAMKYSFL